jgi:hypothetical protein
MLRDQTGCSSEIACSCMEYVLVLLLGAARGVPQDEDIELPVYGVAAEPQEAEGREKFMAWLEAKAKRLRS